MDEELSVAQLEELLALVPEPPYQVLPPSKKDEVGWSVATHDEFILAEIYDCFLNQPLGEQQGWAKHTATLFAAAPSIARQLIRVMKENELLCEGVKGCGIKIDELEQQLRECRAAKD